MVRPYTLRDCINTNQLIEVTCRACQRRAFYLPEDLMSRSRSYQDIALIRFRCGKCNEWDVRVRARCIDDRDRGKLYVMRPAGTRTVWKAVRLGKG